MSKKTVDYLSVQDILERFGVKIEKTLLGENSYEVTMSDANALHDVLEKLDEILAASLNSAVEA